MPKFWMTKSRFINGTYVYAEPEKPALVDLPPGTKPSRDMKPEKQGKPDAPKFTGPQSNVAAGPDNKPVGAVEDEGESK